MAQKSSSTDTSNILHYEQFERDAKWKSSFIFEKTLVKENLVNSNRRSQGSTVVGLQNFIPEENELSNKKPAAKNCKTKVGRVRKLVVNEKISRKRARIITSSGETPLQKLSKWYSMIYPPFASVLSHEEQTMKLFKEAHENFRKANMPFAFKQHLIHLCKSILMDCNRVEAIATHLLYCCNGPEEFEHLMI